MRTAHRLLPLLLLLALAPSARGALVDRVVAVVDTELVLASEVRLEEELAGLDEPASPFWAPGRSTPRERLMDAAAVRVAAAKIVLYQPEEDDVRARREAVRARFDDRQGWNAFLDRHGLTEEGLLILLRRRMIVERYLARNVQAPVEDRGAWLEDAEELVAGLRGRLKVRTIEEVPR